MPNPKHYSALVTEFHHRTVENLITGIKSFRTKNSALPEQINLSINSYGGDIQSLYAMIDFLEYTKIPVLTFNYCNAMSCGGLLLASGTKGKRYMAENSCFMVHQSQFTIPASASIQQIDSDKMRTWSESHKSSCRTFLKRLDCFCGKKEGYFQEKVCASGNGNIYMGGEEALSEGAVDIIGYPEDFIDWDIISI